MRLYLRLDGGPLQAGEFRVTAGAYVVGCPRCGHVAPLPSTHTVQRGGTVTPIWACPSEACPEMQWLRCEEVV